MQIKLLPQAYQALVAMENSGHHLFLTGRAGTGKSTLLDYFRQTTRKNVVVLAPTGVAAVNVMGQTLHSFCRFTPQITLEKVQRLPFEDERRKLLRNLDTILIDEVSMVRADLLDCVDKFLRLNGRNPAIPFGGCQIILVGDLYQLPPVVTPSDRLLFGESGIYPSPYFFDAHVFEEVGFRFIELQQVYRQQDERFVQLLNAIRINAVTPQQLWLLNQQTRPRPPVSFTEDLMVCLTVTNKLAAQVNQQHLEKLPGATVTYNGILTGSFSAKQLPTSAELSLKPGAQVMLLHNDSQGRWVNGTMGKVAAIGVVKGETGEDLIEVELESGQVERIGMHIWEMFEYQLHPISRQVESKMIGAFTQYPLKLAWAVTIHKSQGKTFERVVIDVGHGTFAHGQLYVALSRCRSLQGITLRRPLLKRHVIVDGRIVRFLDQCRKVGYWPSSHSLP